MPDSVFQHQRRVIYAECTVGNHVYYSRYLDMLEEARGEFFRQAGRPLLDLQENGMAFPVIEAEIAFKGPARYDDLLTFQLWLTELRGIRLSFGFRIVNASGATLAERLKARVAPTTWSDVGGPGEIYFDQPSKCLLVLQGQPAQAAIEEILASGAATK